MVHLTKCRSFHTRSSRQITYTCLEIVLYLTKLCAKRNDRSKRSISIIVRSLLNISRFCFLFFFSSRKRFVKEWDSLVKKDFEKHRWKVAERRCEWSNISPTFASQTLLDFIRIRISFQFLRSANRSFLQYTCTQHFPEFLLFLFFLLVFVLRDVDFLLIC